MTTVTEIKEQNSEHKYESKWNYSIHPMHDTSAVSVPDRDRLWATQLRLSSHRLAIETGRRSRIPRNNRLCSCGAIQREEHVICFCPLSQSIRFQFDTVEFTSIAKFFDCANADLVCRIIYVAWMILSSYDWFGVFLSMVFSLLSLLLFV